MELGVELVFVWIKWVQDRMEDITSGKKQPSDNMKI
jgi:hypothetical protein